MQRNDVFVRYCAVNSDDPYVSAIAAHGDVLITGTIYGDLYMVVDGRNEFIDSYHGSIVALQVRKCPPKELNEFVYVICATALGYIYVHLVCVSNLAASRVIYKLRTGQEIIGITIHPSFALKRRSGDVVRTEKSTDARQGDGDGEEVDDDGGQAVDNNTTSCRPSDGNDGGVSAEITTTAKRRRETYDLRHLLTHRQESRCKHVGDIECSDSSMVVALSRGAMYIIMLDKFSSHGPDSACSLIYKFRKTYRTIQLLWNHDLVAWADDDGTQILLLKKLVPVAFIPHPLSIESDHKRNSPERMYTPLAELVDLDDFYNTSDESDIDSTRGADSDDDGNRVSSKNKQIDQKSENISIHDDDDNSDMAVTREVKEEGYKSWVKLGKYDRLSQRGIAHDKGLNPLVDRKNTTSSISETNNDGRNMLPSIRSIHRTPERSDCSACVDGSSNRSTQCGSTLRDVVLPDSHLSHAFDTEVRKVHGMNVSQKIHGGAITDGVRRRRAKMAAMIRAHEAHTGKGLGEMGNLGSLNVVLCWLSQRRLIVGTKNLMRVIDIVPAKAEDRDEELNVKISKKHIRLLETNNATIRVGKHIMHPFITLKEKKIVRDGPLRAYVSYSFESPQTHRIMAIMRHIGEGLFSVIYGLDSAHCGSHVIHVRRTANSSFFKMQREDVDVELCTPKEIGRLPKERRSLTYNVFDSCFDNAYLKDAFVQPIREGDDTRSFRKYGLMHLTLHMMKQHIDIERTKHIAINVFRGLNWKILFHPKDATERSNSGLTSSGSIMDAFTSSSSKMMSSATEGFENMEDGVICCFRDPESFEGVFMIKRGMIFSITMATLQQHIDQLCDHGAHRYAFEEIIRHYNEIVNAERYVHDKFRNGISSMLSSRFIDVKNVAYLTLLYIKACNELMDDTERSDYIHEIVSQFAHYRRLNILLGYIVPLNNMDGGTEYYKAVCKVAKKEILGMIDMDMPFVLLRMAATTCHDPETMRKMLGMLKQYLCTSIGIVKRGSSKKGISCECLMDAKRCPTLADALVECVYPMPYSAIQWNELAHCCEALDVNSLNLELVDRSIVEGCPSDYELLSYYSPRGCDFLEAVRYMKFGPQLRACVIAIGILLAKTGNLRVAFKFLVYAETDMAIHIAKILCDTDPDAHSNVIAAVLDLYHINPQKANEVLTEVFVDSVHMQEVIGVLEVEPLFLFSYLSTIYANGRLPGEYVVPFFRQMSLIKPLEVVGFVRKMSSLIKEKEELCSELLTIVLETQRTQRERVASGSGYRIQKEMYMAEALLRWIRGHQWGQVYIAIMLATRVDMLDGIMKTGAYYMLERLSTIVYRVFNGKRHDIILQRIVHQIDADIARKGKSSRTGMELYLRLMQYNEAVIIGQYRINTVAMNKVTRRLLDALKRGMVVCVNEQLVSPDTFLSNPSEVTNLAHSHQAIQDEDVIDVNGSLCVEEGPTEANLHPFIEDSLDEKETFNTHVFKVGCVCSLCNSVSIGFPCNSRRTMCIVHTLFNRIKSNVKYIDIPREGRVFYFFCGHYAHEVCQIKVINEAIALRVEGNVKEHFGGGDNSWDDIGPKHISDITNESDIKYVESLIRSCLSCIHHMAEVPNTPEE